MSKQTDVTKEAPSSQLTSQTDPLLAYLIFTGVGIGLWQLNFHFRLTVLWLVLLGAALFYCDREPLDIQYSLLALGRGALIGFILSFPFLLFFRDYLSTFVSRLFSTRDVLALFQWVVLLAAPIEGLFFRGLLQERRGLSIATGLYATAGVIYFLPRSPILALLIAMLVMGTLGGVYGYVRIRYGLTASIGCQAMTSFVLMVCPLLIDQFLEMLA